jgi:hypothetical protein
VDDVSEPAEAVAEAVVEAVAVDRRPVAAGRRDPEAAAEWASSRRAARTPKGRTA